MIYNHNADKTTRFQSGDHILNGITAPIVYETRSLSFRERALTSFQLSGEHVIPGLNKMRIEWSAANSSSSMDEPDLRFFANNYNGENDSYNIDLSSYASPTHFFRFLEDKQTEAKVDFTLPFLSGKSKSNKIKFGALYSTKTRDFSENRFEVVEYNNSTPYGGNATDYFSDANTGLIGTLDNGRNEIGNYVADQSDPDNNYEGAQDIWATYGMLTYQLTEKLKVIAGARLESTDISVQSKNDLVADSLNTGRIDKLNILPTLNMVYSLNDKMNVRAAYSNTIARPNMRELAPFNSFEFIGDAIFYGNPDLDQTDITNLDLRWEYFTNPGEIFAISAYYKNFVNPIIKSVRPFTANPEFEFRNVENAQVYGIELEFRKSLAVISPKLEKFKLGANASFIKSVVQIPLDELEEIKANDPNFSATERQFQGQSPFVLNANLSYQDLEKGIDAVIAFNFFDDRLAFIGSNGTPDIFEKGRGLLDFFFTKTISKNTSIKFSAKNLLNATYKIASEFKNSEHIYSSYTLGQTFGLTFNYTIR
jgi:TonB-dependent receptor